MVHPSNWKVSSFLQALGYDFPIFHDNGRKRSAFQLFTVLTCHGDGLTQKPDVRLFQTGVRFFQMDILLFQAGVGLIYADVIPLCFSFRNVFIGRFHLFCN